MAAEKRLRALLGHLRPEGGPSAAPVAAYRYTLSAGSVLSDTQRAAYERDGYLVVPGLVSGADLQTFTERFKELCSGADKTPGLTIMKDVSIAKSEFREDERAVTKIQNFQVSWRSHYYTEVESLSPSQQDPVLSRYFCLPAILSYVECFTGPDIMAMHTMLINKPPDPGLLSSRHPLHQGKENTPHYTEHTLSLSLQTCTTSHSDLQTASSVPGLPWSMFTVAMVAWWLFQAVTRAFCSLTSTPNGRSEPCLPLSLPLVDCCYIQGGVNKMYHGIQNFDPALPRQHLEMQAGDTVFFHPLLVHGSGTNRTAGFRKVGVPVACTVYTSPSLPGHLLPFRQLPMSVH